MWDAPHLHSLANQAAIASLLDHAGLHLAEETHVGPAGPPDQGQDISHPLPGMESFYDNAWNKSEDAGILSCYTACEFS